MYLFRYIISGRTSERAQQAASARRNYVPIYVANCGGNYEAPPKRGRIIRLIILRVAGRLLRER